MSSKTISIRGAREHNLKGVDGDQAARFMALLPYTSATL